MGLFFQDTSTTHKDEPTELFDSRDESPDLTSKNASSGLSSFARPSQEQ